MSTKEIDDGVTLIKRIHDLKGQKDGAEHLYTFEVRSKYSKFVSYGNFYI